MIRGIDAFDREGKKISLEKYGRLLDDPDYKIVQQEDVGPYWVSTVWIGVDHNFFDSGPPIIFETMVFAGSAHKDKTGLLEFDMMRYATEEEARQGHFEMVTLVRATLQAEPDMAPPETHEQGNGQ